jgi:hypothetical protein
VRRAVGEGVDVAADGFAGALVRMSVAVLAGLLGERGGCTSVDFVEYVLDGVACAGAGVGGAVV